MTATVDYKKKTLDSPGNTVDQKTSELMDDIDEFVATTELAVNSTDILPEIKGLEALKDGIVLGDVEKTVDDMARIIANMEAQLRRFLSMNSVLEKDLKDSKEIIATLKAEKDSMEDRLSQLEKEMPSMRELQIEIEHIVEERTATQQKIHDMTGRISQLQGAVDEYRKQAAALETEKADAVAEVNFIESRLNAAKTQAQTMQAQIKQLQKDKNAYQKKIIELQEECQRELELKYNLARELKEARGRVAELNKELADTKLNAKKSFYENVDKIRKG